MKHFADARNDALSALAKARTTVGFEKGCLVVDLSGRCRALVYLDDESKVPEAKKELAASLAPAADLFWGNEVWVEHPASEAAERAVFGTVWREGRAEPPGQKEIFVLDRRLSKDAWMGMPFDPPWALVEGKTPPVISFYSFKGGVGRTTLLLATAVNLSRAGQRVAIIDFDLEAPGAGELAAGRRAPGAAYGVVDYLLEKAVVGGRRLDVREYCQLCEDHAIIQDGVPVVVVPAGVLDQWYLEKLARVNYENLYRTAAEATAPRSPLHDLLRSLKSEFSPDVVLIDSRAGLHDLGGLSLSGLAHLQVLLGLNSEQSWAGLTLAVAHLGKQMVLGGRTQRDCTIVHAMVPPQDLVRADELRRFKERSFAVFAENYYDQAEMPGAEWPLPDMESHDDPHYPFALTWDNRVLGYGSLGAVAEYLTQGEFKSAAQVILAKVGKGL